MRLRRHRPKHDLAVAVREVGRVERTLFIIDWSRDTDMRHRASLGLNKGEAQHALKNALRIVLQGAIQDRTSKAQHFRNGGLNHRTEAIIYWNTDKLGRAGIKKKESLLKHIPSPEWVHMPITGEHK